MELIETVHIPIRGFQQDDGEQSGVEVLWRERLRPLAGAATLVVTPLEWDHDWKDYAAFLSRLNPEGAPPPKLCVYAYSWGAGWGFISLAKQLGKLDPPMRIALAVLTDPV